MREVCGDDDFLFGCVEVEPCRFAIEDIRPRHEEGCACQVFGDGIKLSECEVGGKSLLCGWDRFFWLTFSDYTNAVTARSDGYEVDFGIAAL